MIDTSTSLLARLQSADQSQAWSRFVSLYTPMLFHWIRRQGVPASDAADLVQEVFAVLVTKLPTFHYDRARSFSAWLRTITTNKCRDYFRRRRAVAEVSAAAVDGEVPDHAELFSESEYRRGLARRALEVMQANFEPTTWRSCWELVVCGKSAAEVSRQLGLSINAVYVAKCRVLRRLREELEGLWE